MTPDRIAQIREEAQSEHRTHEWADAVIEELLAAAEAADRRIRDLTFAVRSAATLMEGQPNLRHSLNALREIADRD
ncbi:hypothetical protein ACGFLS_32425 [Streptomyces abikoensis]|uniref:hypothetical protein n=1 Tax=Streptomyces abikoensis TaxID=97398 RepID=UPI00371239B0